jgi:hypothetical protein
MDKRDGACCHVSKDQAPVTGGSTILPVTCHKRFQLQRSRAQYVTLCCIPYLGRAVHGNLAYSLS